MIGNTTDLANNSLLFLSIPGYFSSFFLFLFFFLLIFIFLFLHLPGLKQEIQNPFLFPGCGFSWFTCAFALRIGAPCVVVLLVIKFSWIVFIEKPKQFFVS